MQAFFQFLADNPYILLFFTVGMAVWVGKFSVKGYGLGMVAAAVVVGAALATWASTYGVKLQLDNFAKSLFYYLFMYGVGLRVGPAFFNSLKKDGITFTILAVVCAFLGLCLVVLMCKLLDLPAGCGRRRAGRFADDVGGDRHGGNGGRTGRLQDPRRPTAEQITAHDRAGLWRDLHLGHGRHHPDLQVPAALVGHRCAGGRRAVRGRARRQERRRRRHHRLSRRRPARLPARQRDGRRQVHPRVPPGLSAVPHRQRRTRRRGARRRPGDRAAAGRRDRAGRPARGADRRTLA